ncbi:unnamed protein product [Tetraodon nigroviridis]|uniref:(spotted green pufferfish) hypothetical protein n=1 Tax=Tetraodon nigroviridis TaxID=99883 RepID=Q4T5C1_TETNG|nr:unnamed protein product [Tetraodon nigroviridis]
MNQMQEYLHDANRRLLCEYSEAKLHLLYLQTAPAALENAEELNALCNEVVLKYKAPPVCEDYSDQASLLANNDLLEVNTELQNLNNAMSQDIAMLEKKFNEVFSQNPQKKSQSSTSLSNIGEAADLETAPGHAWVDNVLCNREEKRADRAMRDQIRMIRALQKSLEALQEQLDQTEKLKSFSVTTIEELQEQKEVLQEKVKTLEQMQKKSKEPKLQRGKHRRKTPLNVWSRKSGESSAPC